MHWQLNRIQYPIYNLGPGKRIGFWVQGCSRKCEGCISKTLWKKSKGRKIKIDYLVHQICKIEKNFEGVTITGGEPFDQYESLIAFCAFLKQKSSLNIYCFSGYYLDELVQKHPDKLFMKYIDYLLDGRYLLQQHENKNVRGSSNQQLYKFINSQPKSQKSFFTTDKWSVFVNNKQVYMSGIPKYEDLISINKDFENKGINIKFK